MAIVNIYQVTYHNNRHNGANASKMTALVSAASSDATVIATAIQNNDANGKTVTIETITLFKDNVIQ